MHLDYNKATSKENCKQENKTVQDMKKIFDLYSGLERKGKRICSKTKNTVS